MCVMLKQMRDDKLYKELGYSNFEDYCENEVGMSRHMAYKYTNALEIKNVESIQHLGITKLSLLASLSESQQEEIQRTVDIEETSVRELKAEIASLKTKANEADVLSQRIDDLNENCRRISDSLTVSFPKRIRSMPTTLKDSVRNIRKKSTG